MMVSLVSALQLPQLVATPDQWTSQLLDTRITKITKITKSSLARKEDQLIKMKKTDVAIITFVCIMATPVIGLLLVPSKRIKLPTNLLRKPQQPKLNQAK